MDELLKMVLPLLATLVTVATPLLVAYLVQYLRKQLRKVGLEATDQELETVKKIATEAIHYAAQRAKVQAKDGEIKTTSGEKKALALSFAKKLADKYGVNPGVVETLDDMLEAALGAHADL